MADIGQPEFEAYKQLHGRYDATGMQAPLSPSPISPGSEPALAPAALVENHVHISRALAVGSLLGLILLSLVWELLAAPLRPGGSWLALKALPLCMP